MAKNASGSINAKSIGVVKGLIGTATATDASGVARELHNGDRVYANEVVQTSAAGTVHVEFGNKGYVDIGHGSTLALDKTVFDPNAKSGQGDGSLANMRAKIAAGADPTEVTDPTAAGPTAGGDGGEQGGHNAVFVQQNAAQGSLSVSQGFETSSANNPQAAAGTEGAILRVNNDPVAEPATAEAVEGGDTVIGNVTATDIDGDPLTYSLVGDAPAGLTFNPDGSYSFDPTDPAYDSMAQGDIQTITVNYTVADAFGGIDTSTLTITLTGTNDAATITASDAEDTAAVEAGGVANLVPGDPDASGKLTVSDVDHDENHFQTPASLVGQYGTFTFDPDTGAWTYTLNNDLPTTQALTAGEAAQDVLTVTSLDGTANYDITVNITGANDTAVVTGTATDTVREAGSGLNFGDPFASGNLDVSDMDAGESHFHMPTLGSLVGDYGIFTFNPINGAWTYTLNNLSPATQALNAGATAQDTLTVTTHDGTPQTITVNIIGTNDNALIIPGGLQDTSVREDGGVNNGTLSGNSTAGGKLNVYDVDNGENQFAIPANLEGKYGTFSLTPNGNWTYTLNNTDADTQALTAGQRAQDKLVVSSLDGTASYTITVNITGANDNAEITGSYSGNVVEAGGVDNDTAGDALASGVLTVTDVDAGQALFQTPASLGGTYGAFTFNASTGAWTYELNDNLPATQALNGGDVATDTLTVTSLDGTASQTITVNITGANDSAEITGTYVGDVVEAGGVANGSAGVPSATGTLTVTDVDDGEAAFQAPEASSLAGTYGTFEFNASTGEWTYTLNNDLPATQALNGGDAATDTLTVTSLDGTASQTITVNITGANDTAVVTGTATDTVTEAGGFLNLSRGDPSASGNLDVSDVDAGEAHFHMPALGSLVGDYGIFTFNPINGAWTYTLNNLSPATQALNAGVTAQDTLTVTTHDGTPQIITVTINGSNDNAFITVGGPQDTSVTEAGGVNNAILGDPSAGGKLNVSDVDAGQNQFAIPANLEGKYGTFTFAANGTWTYTLNNNDPDTEALTAGQRVQDKLTVTSLDGTASHTITVNINGANDALPANNAPVANPDSASTTEGQSVTILASELLANDNDVDGDTLSLTSVQNAVNGTVSLVDGTITFTPDAGFDSAHSDTPASFTYTISDGKGGTSTATVTVDVADSGTVTGGALKVDATVHETAPLHGDDLTFNSWTVTTINHPPSGATNPYSEDFENSSSNFWAPSFNLSNDSLGWMRNAGSDEISITSSGGSGANHRLQIQDKSSASGDANQAASSILDINAGQTVSFDYRTSDFGGSDQFTYQVYDTGTDSYVTLGNTASSLPYYTSSTSAGLTTVTVYNLDGDYRLVFSVDDRTSGGGRATVYIDNLTVTTPATPGWVETVTTPHEINVADLIWTSVAPISGEINLANYITGTEATTLSIAGSPSDANGVITVIGIYGTLTFYTEAYDGHVAGSYVYDPIDTLTAGGQETFNIALNQMDGDSATIALTVNTVGSLLHDGDTSSVYVVQHGNYDASASDHGEYIFGDDTGLQLTGSSHNDYIQGGAGSDTLTGGAGSDLLIGGGGSDILVGGAGDDVLTGGLGSDTFKYQAGDLDSTAVHGDVITDFKVDTIANGGDVLDISGVLPAGLSETDLKDGGYLKFEYVSGDAGTTVVKLSIDADGSAVGGSVYTPLATITMTGAGTIDPTAIMNQLLANQEIKF